MPSGTPTIEEITKPQKMTWMLCHRLWCSQGASLVGGGVMKAV